MTLSSGRAWLLGLVSPLVWFAHFSALYGVASFGEAAGLDLARFDLFAWPATVVACSAVAAVWHKSRHLDVNHGEPARGARAVARMAAVLSMVGILFQGLVLAIIAP